MPAEEALAETEQMTAASASAALAAMKPQQAASIIQVTCPTLPSHDFCMAVIKLGMSAVSMTTGVERDCTSRLQYLCLCSHTFIAFRFTPCTSAHALQETHYAWQASCATCCRYSPLHDCAAMPASGLGQSLELKASCLVCAGSAQCGPTAAAAVCALHPHVTHPASPARAGLHGRPAHHWSPPVQGPAAQHAQRAVQEAAACC